MSILLSDKSGSSHFYYRDCSPIILVGDMESFQALIMFTYVYCIQLAAIEDLMVQRRGPAAPFY